MSTMRFKVVQGGDYSIWKKLQPVGSIRVDTILIDGIDVRTLKNYTFRESGSPGMYYLELLDLESNPQFMLQANYAEASVETFIACDSFTALAQVTLAFTKQA